MLSRLFSTISIWTLVAIALYFGGIHGGLAILLLVSAAAHWEFSGMLLLCGAQLLHRRRGMTVALGVIFQLAVCASILEEKIPAKIYGNTDYRAELPGLFIGAIALVLLFIPDKLVSVFTKAPTALSWLYIPCSIAPLGILSASFWANGHDKSGMLLAVWLVGTVKFADCGALLLGLSFGEKRHRMAPSISPGKSWEGCAGALIGAAAAGAGIAWLFTHFHGALGWQISPERFNPAKAALLALPLGILGIPSDLIESVFKRKASLKDSGKTIPGIGGAFDLLDSLVLTIPAGCLLFKFFVLN
ncbi:MAG: phosphatidate cytidylyltransferase [Puniceicoccales bacterium]|jgi:phosphatidate cytidylyltransferase|nr:phosphatidate cytidylyltransferase [Puniceicoccales bacterium]